MNPKLRSDQTKSLPSLVCPHFFKPRPIALALSALLLCTAHSQAGEVVRYPVPDSTLRTVGLGHTDSLAPANLESVTGNQVFVSDATGLSPIAGSAFAAYHETLNTAGNLIEVSGASVINNSVYGGFTDFAASTGNTARLSGTAKVQGSLYGAYVIFGAGQASGNKIELSGTSQVGWNAMAGKSNSGPATGNMATLGGSTKVTGSLYGGLSSTGVAQNNTVLITDKARVKESVYGGASNGPGAVSGNKVEILGDAWVDEKVNGGSSSSGAVSRNEVHVGGAAGVGEATRAGYSFGGEVTDNVAIVDGQAKLYGTLSGGHSAVGAARGNRVTLSGNAELIGVPARGGSGYTLAANNTVILSDHAQALLGIIGGVAYQQAVGNTAIAGDDVQVGEVFGGLSALSTATGNRVEISGRAKVSRDVAGGMSLATDGTGHVTGNTVLISGTPEFLGENMNIYGGRTDSGRATGNTVVISGAPKFATDGLTGTSIIGGSSDLAGADTFTGNTLEVRTTGLMFKSLKSFEYIHFYLPQNVNTIVSVITLTDTTLTDLSSSKIGVAVAGGLYPALKEGDRLTLVHTGGGLLTSAGPLVNHIKGMQGISTRYDFALTSNASNLEAFVTRAELNPQLKSLSEGKLGGLAFVNQGADLAVGMGMDRARAAAQSDTNGFGAISGGDTRYKSGSHVDVKGVSLVAGLSKGMRNADGTLMLGGFFEAGSGNYDSYNSFADAGNVHAKGDNRYYGLGVLARQDFASGVYVEGSARFGKLKNDYRSTDLVDALGNPTSYNQRKTYYGLHAGLGYVLPLASGEIDLYGRYLLTHQQSSSHVIAGDLYHFDGMDSHRTRLGVVYHHRLSEQASFKIGTAWEYEFDGKVKGSVHGKGITAPDIKGCTGILDVGFKLQPSQNKAMSVDVGLQGYAGKREGLTGNVALKYAF